MSRSEQHMSARYDLAAPKWGDKTRLLGYFDSYLGFLSAPGHRTQASHVVDIGTGTGAFAEAWVAINGAPDQLSLVDPSENMLHQARAALHRRQVVPHLHQGLRPRANRPR